MNLRTTITVVAVGVALLATGRLVYSGSSFAAYGEAEPLQVVAAEFSEDLADRADRNKEPTWVELSALLAEERFAVLRNHGFLPPRSDKFVLEIRVNPHFDLLLLKEGGATISKRRGSGDPRVVY